MTEKRYSFQKMFFRVTAGQIAFNLFILVTYFIHVFISAKQLELNRKEPDFVELILELGFALTVVNIIVIGNRYVVVWTRNRFSTNKNYKAAFFSFINQMGFAFLSFNILLIIEGFFTNPLRDVYEASRLLGAANLLFMPACGLYYAVENARHILDAYIQQSIALERIEKDKKQTHLHLLQAQFNPHFLFNALNSVYFQFSSTPISSHMILPRFKTMMRYLTFSCSETYVSLTQEVEYIQNYIDIQMIRKGEDIISNVDISISDGKCNISPFILQPFIENAFKYISGEMRLSITLVQKKHQLIYTVINSVDQQMMDLPPSNGVGLDNLKQRLLLLYPHTHSINCRLSQNQFVAEMQLSLKR